MQEKRELPKHPHMSLQFVEILKSIGFELKTSKLSSNNFSGTSDKDIVYMNAVMKEGNSDENNDSAD